MTHTQNVLWLLALCLIISSACSGGESDSALVDLDSHVERGDADGEFIIEVEVGATSEPCEVIVRAGNRKRILGCRARTIRVPVHVYQSQCLTVQVGDSYKHYYIEKKPLAAGWMYAVHQQCP